MPLDLLLRLPTRPGPSPLDRRPAVATDLRGGAFGPFDLLDQAARAAEVAGFDGVVLPFDPAGEHPVAVAGHLLSRPGRLRVVQGIDPAFATPVYAAKVAVSLQRLGGDRLGWWLDLDGGGGPAYGDALTGADRWARDVEHVAVARRTVAGTTFTHRGDHYEVVDGGFADPLSRRPFPDLTVAITDPSAWPTAARLGDRVAVDGTDVDAVAVAVARLRGAAGDGPGPELTAVVDGAGPPEAVAAHLRALADAGATTVVVGLPTVIEDVYRFGHEVRPLLPREAVAS